MACATLSTVSRIDGSIAFVTGRPRGRLVSLELLDDF